MIPKGEKSMQRVRKCDHCRKPVKAPRKVFCSAKCERLDNEAFMREHENLREKGVWG